MLNAHIDARTVEGRRAIALKLAIDAVGHGGFHASEHGYELQQDKNVQPIIAAAGRFLGFLNGDTVPAAAEPAASKGDHMTEIARANLFVLSKSEPRFLAEYSTDVVDVMLGIDKGNPEQMKVADQNRALFGTDTPNPITLTLAQHAAAPFEIGTCVPIGLSIGGDPTLSWSAEESRVTA